MHTYYGRKSTSIPKKLIEHILFYHLFINVWLIIFFILSTCAQLFFGKKKFVNLTQPKYFKLESYTLIPIHKIA